MKSILNKYKIVSEFSIKNDYNNHDDRVYKYSTFATGAKTYYLRDASGKELAALDVNTNKWTHYAHGRERVAEFENGNVNYYNYDHLGSVRVMYQVANACTDYTNLQYTILSANDYFANSRTLRAFNNTGKYAYQGSEKEKELSDNDYYTHFRELNTEIARWWQVDPKQDEQMNFSPYVSMNNNPVSNIDPLGDKIHASFKTWVEIWRQSANDRAFRQEIRRQMFDRRTTTNNLQNGRVHTETYAQHYHYNINLNSNTTIRQAVFANQTISNGLTNTTPANNNHFPTQGFNINKSETFAKWGQGDETRERNVTKATTVVSDNTYQNGSVNITFTPNINDNNGGDRIQVFQGTTLLYNQVINVNPNDVAGYTNIVIPFNGPRNNIKIKITDSGGGQSSRPGAFDFKATLTGF